MKRGGKRKFSSAFHQARNNPATVPGTAPVVDANGDNGESVVVADAEPHVVAPPLEGGGEKKRVEDSGEDSEDGEGEEVEGDAVVEAGADAVPLAEKEQGSSLDDDYYEVEAILRKKFVKGKAFYLVKWYGWPDSNNTWEPLENLHRVRDIVAAFEERWNTPKQRKARRKSTGSLSITRARVERSLTPYSLRRLQSTTANNHALPAPPVPDLPYADIPAYPQPVIFADEVENVPGASSVQRGNRVANEEPEYDPKLIELRASTNNGHDADKLAMQLQGNNLASGDGQTDGQSNGVGQVSDQSDRRRGSKRRKSGSVKRFKKDLHPGDSSISQNPYGMPGAAVEPGRRGPADNVGKTKKAAHAKPPSIIRIVRPLQCAPPVPTGSQKDCLVTFMVKRSDGAEVMVDNQYLKKDYPDMLIDFYEMHLRHSPTY